MPRAPRSPMPMSRADARALWIRAQRLDATAPFGDGPDAVRAAVEHLGYVQIDTIHVIERAHHHVLWSRIPAYARADLDTALSVGEIGLRRLGARAGLHPDPRLPLFHLRHARPARGRPSVGSARSRPPICAASWHACAATGRSRSATSRSRRSKRPISGPAANPRNARSSSAFSPARSRSAAGAACSRPTISRTAISAGRPARAPPPNARSSNTCSTARCGPKARSASPRSATWTPRAKPRWRS